MNKSVLFQYRARFTMRYRSLNLKSIPRHPVLRYFSATVLSNRTGGRRQNNVYPWYETIYLPLRNVKITLEKLQDDLIIHSSIIPLGKSSFFGITQTWIPGICRPKKKKDSQNCSFSTDGKKLFWAGVMEYCVPREKKKRLFPSAWECSTRRGQQARAEGEGILRAETDTAITQGPKNLRVFLKGRVRSKSPKWLWTFYWL